MMSSLDPLKVSSYYYDLPPHLIASTPSYPKDEGKLLIYERATKKITHTTFGKIFDFIPKDTNIVLNDTKVIKARIFGTKQSGGRVELLLNSPKPDSQFLVYIKGRVKKDIKIFFEDNLIAIVKQLHDDGTRTVEFFLHDKQLAFIELEQILTKIGHIPLPPYIKREDTKEDEEEYQSVFAKNIGAVAAPTASLHFDENSFKKLKDMFDTHFITLHVGAGTFKSIEVETIDKHKMHSEWYDIPKATKQLLDSSKPILAIGTTVTRTIEYYTREKKQQGYSDLFLHPDNTPQRVNHLLTNFHLPSSTLIMLVASFTSLEETLSLYQEAIKEEYMFYSYGDGMLVI